MSKSKRKHHKQQPDVIMADGWGEVETISQTCYQRLSACAIVIPVIELFQSRPEMVDGNPDVLRACQALVVDVPVVRAELDGIATKHKGRKGDIRETDDFLATIEVSQMYSTWLERFERLIDPNLTLISGYIDQLNQGDKS